MTLSPKAKLLMFVVLVGLILFAVFYYLIGINYSYVIRYPILIATIILFIVAMMMLVVVMSRGIRVPPSRALALVRFGVEFYAHTFLADLSISTTK